MAKQEQYEQFKCEALGCRKCSLGQELNEGFDPHVFGAGSLDAKLLFVAEAPGKNETKTQQCLTKSGKSGAIYEKMLGSLGLTREQVYTCNVLVCRPSQNRPPLPYECLTCRPHLVQQIELVAPKLIITFGRFAASVFIPTDFKITRDHGKVLHSTAFNADIFSLYHPAYVGAYCSLDRREEFKKDVLALKQLLKGV
jgi:DNA polymerase